MYKVILKILIVVVILFGVTKLITITNNIKNIKDDIVFTTTNQRTKNSTDKSLLSPKKATSSDNNITDTPKYTISDGNKNTQSAQVDDSPSSSVTKDNNPDDYSVAVSSSIYNAIVSLDKESKEINIKLLEESDLSKTNTDRYINLSDSDVSYLLSNSSNLVDQFKNYNLIEKYDMVKDMLNKYDTNIKENDLIGLALAYLK